MERRLTTILVADVAGYSRLMSTDETGTLAALNGHRAELIDLRIAENQGRIVKMTGDGLLVEFSSVVNAVGCAAEIQRGMRERNENVPPDRRIEFRIGVNLGDVIVQNGDIFGDGVNVAARLEGIAAPGSIAVSGSVREHVGSRLDLAFEDLGEHRLKNIERVIHVYNIVLNPASATQPRPPAAVAARDMLDLSIAVLPFTNMSGDPEQEYFSDGITEDLITDLSKVSGLYVVARNTVFTYKGKSVKVKQVAQELGVRFVLEGSIRKAGQRIRITGQLIDAKNGGHLWADRYDRSMTDIFAIQDEITRAIVEQLKIKLLPEEKAAVARAPTENVEAYTYYLRGRQFSHEWTKAYLLLARRMFKKAVELDPHYARAYAGIANCDSALHGWHSEEVALDDILEMSARALALDPELAEAHAARGLALHSNERRVEAITEFERALELEPDLYEANYFYARLLYTQGEMEASARYFVKAAEIRPDDYVSPILLTSVYRTLGQTTETENWAQRGIERAERALLLHPENSSPAHRGALALAHLGERERARDWAARALAIAPDDIYAFYNIACAYSILGDIEPALDLLERVVTRNTREQMLWFDNDSDLDPLRDHPRFQRMYAARLKELDLESEMDR
ncbi:adenylate/guanylate cyclase domain-containing protein [Phyllobacterium zundukense]|uniref:Adenylate/guanylate cyclase domain-containing protein n=1 Tax=Phyllobacterium zundukense TaxID=1867719 RepID=A0A2N9VZ48_9HYPH|nr:adenylate/guanylate cyclase domain-containing protein [Phyllobacterium zundukense]ATU90974.1 adenylate/guanylate cyclase domain-containing protein [Phyllobacterium zundukense]PIO44766.1 adenylate/guanylate cyclase domain-containing protein [Phyllobacterium zundukense]